MNKNREKNYNYKKQDKSIPLSTDASTYESYLNKSSVKTPKKTLSAKKKVVEKDGQTNPQLLPLLGFNWREYNYLQNILNDDDDGPIREDYQVECASLTSVSTITKFSEIEGEGVQPTSSLEKLQYLMGLPSIIIEEWVEVESEPEEKAVKPPAEAREGTLAMKRAEHYLQLHKIAQFFQFLNTHLLGVKPDKPIDFLIELLDNCLIYRSGLGAPPLVYDPQHLEQLFYKMDTMKTNFIDLEQYRTGLMTLGIVNYNKRPPLSNNKMISKDYFIQEALKCLTVQLDRMIEKHSSEEHKKVASNALTPPPSSVTLKSK